MLSGFSSYFFGGDTSDESADVSVVTTSADSGDWVFVENPGKKRHFTNICCTLVSECKNFQQ